jgi:hypothetical protein
MRIVIHFPPTVATVVGTSTAILAQYRGRAERFHRFPLQFPALFDGSSLGTIKQEAIGGDWTHDRRHEAKFPLWQDAAVLKDLALEARA